MRAALARPRIEALARHWPVHQALHLTHHHHATVHRHRNRVVGGERIVVVCVVVHYVFVVVGYTTALYNDHVLVTDLVAVHNALSVLI